MNEQEVEVPIAIGSDATIDPMKYKNWKPKI